MTIPTVDANLLHMMLMAERNRLIAHYVGLSRIGRPNDRVDRPATQTEHQHDEQDADARNCVRGWMKRLRHAGSRELEDIISTAVGFQSKRYARRSDTTARLRNFCLQDILACRPLTEWRSAMPRCRTEWPTAIV